MRTIRSVFVAWLLLLCSAVLTPACAGSLFVTGHDPDYHAVQGPDKGGAQRIIQRAIAYAGNNMANPKILLVADLRPSESTSDEYIDSRLGLQAAGFTTFDVAAAPIAGNEGALNLTTVNFNDYDVVVVASGHGGSLRQEELTILNQRQADITRYVNAGGGLVVFNECAPTLNQNPYGFLSAWLPAGAFSCGKLLERYTDIKLTPYGTSIGLAQTDVDRNVSHGTFAHVPGLNIVDYFVDETTPNPIDVVTLAARVPNILDCLPAVNLQCAGSVTLTSRVTEIEGAALRIVWTVNGVAVKTTDVPAGNPPTSVSTQLTRTFSPGTHTVNLSVTKIGGVTVSCTTRVRVKDTSAPTISNCAANKIVAADANCQGTIPDLTAEVRAAAGDNCTPAADLTITQVPAAGTLVGLGVTIVTITVTDAAGNTKTCTAEVTVKDATEPTITQFPANRVLPTNAQCQAAIPNVIGQVVATDNCNGADALTVTQSPAAGTVVGPGAHTITITVKDAAGNATVRTIKVTVRDVTAPTITKCAPSRVLRADSTSRQATLPALTSEVEASDNCPGAVTVTQVPAAGTQLGIGIHTITLTAVDAAGNTATCTTMIGVLPPGAIPVPVDNNCQGVIPDLRSVAVPNPTQGQTVTQSPAPGTIVGPGTYTVIVTLTDANGSTFDFPITVRVRDTTPPAITKCAADRTLTANGSGQATLPDMRNEIETTDNCTGALTVTQSPTGGTLINVGITTVTFTVRDAAGNTATCSAKVTVTDNTPPTITRCASPKTRLVNDQCQAVIPNLVDEVTATDNLTPTAELVITQSPAAGTLAVPGTHTVTITVRDAAGNQSTCTVVVTVKDATVPTVVGYPTNLNRSANANCQAIMPDLTAEIRAVASDNCTASSALVITQSTAAGTLVGLGKHTVTVTVKDAAGNTSVVTVTVTVKDTTAPIITHCCADQAIAADAGGQASMPDLTEEIHATDNCTGAITVTQSPAPGTMVGLGTHTVTFTVRDAAGNTATCAANITAKAANARIKLTKTANVSSVQQGGSVTYTYAVANIGSLKLFNISVRDDNGTPSLAGDDFRVGGIAELAPGATKVFTATVIPPGDFDSDVTNTAVVRAKDASGTVVIARARATVRITR